MFVYGDEEDMDNSLLEKYCEYFESEEAYAVLFVKKYLKAAKGKWIDIIYIKDFGYSNGECLEFKKVVCDVFGKRINPQYPSRKNSYSDYEYKMLCRAITWKTAHEDIENQRENGIVGTRYVISGRKVKSNSIFVDEAPKEIKALEKNLNDRTNPLWDSATKYMKDDGYVFSIKYIKRIPI